MHTPPCGALHHNVAAIQNLRVRVLHHNVVAPQSPGFGPPPQGVGPNPGDAWGVENAPRRGATGPTWPHSNASPHARPPFQPGDESGRVMWGDRILFNPVGVSIAESSTPQGTAPRPTGPGSRTLGFGVPPRCGDDMRTSGCGWPPRCGEEMQTSGCGWPPGCGDETPTLRIILAGRHVVVNTPYASAVTRCAPGRFSWRHGVHPEGLHHNVVAPQSPGFGPPAARRGAEPWGCVRRRACTPTGCDKTDVAPSERVTTRTAPIPTRGRIGPCFVGRPHFVQPRWGFDRRIVDAPGYGSPAHGAGEPHPGLWSATTLW